MSWLDIAQIAVIVFFLAVMIWSAKLSRERRKLERQIEARKKARP